MKKLLFSGLLLIASVLNAQITVNESFEGSTLPNNWSSTTSTGGTASPSFGNSAGTACVGSNAMTKNVYGSTTNASWYPVYSSTDSNGEAISYSFQYLVKPWSSTTNCTLDVDYSADGGTTWTALGTSTPITATTACTLVSGSIPAGTVPVGASFKFRFKIANVGSGDQYFGIDNVKINQLANAPSLCPVVSAPIANATGLAVKPAISWALSNGAANYLLSVGSTPGGTDVLNMFDVGNVTTYTLQTSLNYGSQYYYTVYANNAFGVSSGCAERSFTTRNIACPSVTAPSSASATGVALSPTISWSAVTDATGYRLSVGTTAGGTDVMNNVDLGSVLTYQFPSPLLYGTKYYYTVNAYTPTNISVSCTERNFTTITLCPTVSAPTSNATSVSVTPTFTWSAISGVTGYKLTIGTTSGGTDILNAFDVGNVTTYTLPAAVNYGVKYYYTIVGYAGSQVGTACNERNFTTISLCSSVTAPATNAINVSVTPTFTWTAINGVTGYKLTIGTTTGGNDVLDAFNVGNVTSYVIPAPLNNNVKYYYTIVGYVGSQIGTACVERNFTTVCSAANVPYTLDFDAVVTPAIPQCTIVVNNGSGNAWKTSGAPVGVGFTGNLLNYAFNTDYAANTWFFTQGVNLTAGVSYRIKYKYANSSGSVYAEKMKVAYGSSASSSAMTNVLYDHTSITTAGAAVSNYVDFVPSTSGVFYFGFQAYSALDKNQLYLDDINVNVTPTCLEPTNVVGSYNPANGIVNISWVAPSPVPGNGYELYYSTSSVAPTSSTTPNISGITTTNVDVPSLQSDVVYYVWVRAVCSSTDTSSWSELGSVTTGYCQPTGGTSGQYYLKTISTTGAASNINYTATSYSAYVLNSTMQLTADAGMVVNYSLTPSGGTNNYYIWIDWNKDLDFTDSGETILATTSMSSTKTGNFTVPASQAPGAYRMRVANTWSGSIVPCGPAPYGAYVDFTLNVTNGNLATAEAITKVDDIKIYPNPFSDVLNISEVDKVKSISIMDTSGRMVKSFDKPEAQLRLSDLNSGMYIVILNMKDGSKQAIKAIKK